METIKVNILSDVPGYTKGQTVRVAVDSRGTPLQRFWRRRFSDAKTDNCIEVVKVSKEKTAPKSKTTVPKKQENST